MPEFEKVDLNKTISSLIRQIISYIEPWNKDRCDEKIKEILDEEHEINKKLLSESLKIVKI